MKAVGFISANSLVRDHVPRLGIERRMQRDEIGFGAASCRASRSSCRSRARLPACGAAPNKAFSCRSRARAARWPGRSARRRRSSRSSCRRRSCRRDGSTASREICPARTILSPSIMRRATASISPKCDVGGRFRHDRRHHGDRNAALVASATSILVGRDRLRGDRAQFRIGRQHRAIDLVVQQREQDVAFLHRRDQLRLAMILLDVGIDLDARRSRAGARARCGRSAG